MIHTARLDLIPASVPTVRAALVSGARLGALLDAHAPESWPPELLDDDALQWSLRWLREEGSDPRWGFYWIVLRENGTRILVGTAGYKGNPVDGTVEIGYGVVHDHHRRGYATEASRALIEQAFADARVERVIAETLPELEASIGVLAKCGFSFIGDGSERGVIRYELKRG